MHIVSTTVGSVKSCELAEVLDAPEHPTIEIRCPECEEWLDNCSCYYRELRDRGAV